MVGVGLHLCAMQCAALHRFDDDAVRQLMSLAPHARDLVDQCLQAVRLMPAQMADADHVGRFVGEHQDRRKRRRDFAGRSQVEVAEPVDIAVTADLAVADAV